MTERRIEGRTIWRQANRRLAALARGVREVPARFVTKHGAAPLATYEKTMVT